MVNSGKFMELFLDAPNVSFNVLLIVKFIE